jgi:ketosteroid isomerase-like protein
MTNDNVELIRRAYDACGRGDIVTMLGSVDRDLEWTYLDPAQEDPAPQSAGAGPSCKRRSSVRPSAACEPRWRRSSATATVSWS